MLQLAFKVFERGVYPSTNDMWAARPLEFFPIVGRDWTNPASYHPFESRFAKSARQAGFGELSKGFAGAMFEMADNVVQHSSASGEPPSRGLIGYHVVDNQLEFTISDTGRGVLASLSENPTWNNVRTSKDALLAIVKDHASRRSFSGEGEGFKQLFRSIADYNGVAEIRSLDGRVFVTSGTTGRVATSSYVGSCPGVQVKVACALSGAPKERIFPLDYLT